MFLEISLNSRENTCARTSFLIKLLKKGLWHKRFPVNFAKFLRTPLLQNTSSVINGNESDETCININEKDRFKSTEFILPQHMIAESGCYQGV